MSRYVKIESERYMDFIREMFRLKRTVRNLEARLSLALQAFEVISNISTLSSEEIIELCKITAKEIDSFDERATRLDLKLKEAKENE